jgi:hypothetical protein
MSKRLVLLVERRGRRGARADVRADQTLEDGRYRALQTQRDTMNTWTVTTLTILGVTIQAEGQVNTRIL